MNLDIFRIKDTLRNVVKSSLRHIQKNKKAQEDLDLNPLKPLYTNIKILTPT